MSPEDQYLRLDAYYYEFDQTGVREIDVILSAVACAGKAAHHTEDWGEWVNNPERYGPFRGPSPVDWIQNAANDAATARAERDAEVTRLREALRGLLWGLEPPEYDDDFGANRYGGPDPDAPRRFYWSRPEVKAARAALTDGATHDR